MDTVDPIRDGANWFVYVNNDPVNWRDPWGLESWGSSMGVDINYFSPDDPKHLREYAEIVPRHENMLVVGGHGTKSEIQSPNGWLDAKELADEIRRYPGYYEGEAVALYSCDTGSDPNGLAQQLANELKAIVYAPDNLPWYYSDGSDPVIAPRDPKNYDEPDINNRGNMNMFFSAKSTR
jgi:hypothetical protein